MNRIKLTLSGATVGLLIGMVSLAVTAVAATALSTQIVGRELSLGAWLSLAPFSVFNGLVIGGLSGALGCSFETRELTVFALLISMALGSVSILSGDFDNQSLMPVAIYLLGGLNGLCSAPVIAAVVCQGESGRGKRFAA